MSKPKVLMTASTFPRWEGDTEPRFVLDLAKALSDEYDVTVLAPSFPGAKLHEMMEGVRVERYRYFPVNKLETLCYPGAVAARIKENKVRAFLVPFLILGLWRYIFVHRKEYAVMHAHWVIPQGIVQSWFKKPYILTGHGGDIMSMNKGFLKDLKKNAFEKASQVVVVSKQLAEKVREMAPSVEPQIISMGCDTTMFSSAYRKENYFSQNDRKVILFVGRLEEVKGVEYLIDAMEYTEAKLVIVGGGSLEVSLKKRAERFGERIEFLGPKTHAELKEIYPSADVFVMSSVTTQKGAKEGFGLVMLEAMASGVPVVAFASGGIPQLITHDVNGLLCEEKDIKTLAENINSVLSDEELRNRLIQNGNRTVKEYDYKEIAKKYSRIYEDAMNR